MPRRPLLPTISATPVGTVAPDARDKCFCLCSAHTDADASGFARHANIADIDIVTAQAAKETHSECVRDVSCAKRECHEFLSPNPWSPLRES